MPSRSANCGGGAPALPGSRVPAPTRRGLRGRSAGPPSGGRGRAPPPGPRAAPRRPSRPRRLPYGGRRPSPSVRSAPGRRAASRPASSGVRRPPPPPAVRRRRPPGPRGRPPASRLRLPGRLRRAARRRRTGRCRAPCRPVHGPRPGPAAAVRPCACSRGHDTEGGPRLRTGGGPPSEGQGARYFTALPATHSFQFMFQPLRPLSGLMVLSGELTMWTTSPISEFW